MTAESLKILVFDVSTTSRMLISKILAGADAGVCAETSSEAETYRAVESYRPDIIMLNLSTLGVDACNVIAKAKKIHADAKIVIMASRNDGNIVLKCLKSGADEFITKPYEASKVIETLNYLSGGRKLYRKKTDE